MATLLCDPVIHSGTTGCVPCSVCLEQVCPSSSESSPPAVCDACAVLTARNPAPVLTVPCTTTPESLFITTNIGGQKVSLLVDTGSVVSLVSTAVWHTLVGQKAVSPARLTPPTVSVQSVTGSPVAVTGRVELPIEIASDVRCRHPFLVADIEVSGILGLDFLRATQCQIDMSNSCLVMGGTTYPLDRPPPPGIASPRPAAVRFVRLLTPVVVPGYSQTLAPASVPEQAGSFGSVALIEPRTRFLDKHLLAMTPTLVEDKSCREYVPICLQNLSLKPVTIPKDTIIGELHSCTTMDDEPSLPPAPLAACCNATVPAENPATQPFDLFERPPLDDGNTKELAELLSEYSDVISTGPQDLGTTSLITHTVETSSERPIRQAPRRIPVHLQSEVKAHVDDLLHRDIISPSTSPWSAPIVTVRKPDQSLRLCVDYRKLNAITIKEAYPIPRVGTAIDQMSSATVFSTLDLTSGYWQVELDQAARQRAAFVTPFGLYEWRSMPFGLCNAPATFQRLMNEVLGDLQGSICMVYLDDFVIYSRSVGEHFRHLRTVLQRLRQAGLKIKPQKCRLFADSVTFLGHRLSAEGVSPDPAKYAAVRDWPTPSSPTAVRQFTGFATYYRRFIPNFSTIAAPLNKLTEKQASFQWTPACQDAFEALRHQLVTAPVLAYPDPGRPFLLDTDASEPV